MASDNKSAVEADIKIPPSSQSHFAKFDKFTPDDAAPFDDEFKRLAACQEWVPGSQQYTKERTIAMRAEIKSHFFSSQQAGDDTSAPITKEDELVGYQALCEEVGLPCYDTTGECKRELKKTLVNIVDLIDTRRVSKKVEIWQDFEAFRDYTLQDEHRFNKEEAKKDGGYLASLLQQFGSRRNRRKTKRPNGIKREIVSGRVVKKERK